MSQPIINATGRAIISCIVLAFAIASIVWVVFNGNPHNSLHESALSWSYMLVIFTLIGLGIDSAASTFIASAYGSVVQKPTP